MGKTSQCKKCRKNYKVLTLDNMCYYCHVKVHGNPPTKGCWETGEQRPMKLGIRGGKKGK